MFRHRWVFLVIGSLLAAFFSWHTDPDANGLSTLLGGLAIIQGIWAVAAAYWSRRALMDYPEANMQSLFAKAAQEPTGAGLALIAMAIIFMGLLLVFSSRAHADPLPAGFLKYGDTLKAEQRAHWPGHPDPAALAALVEQESCVSLKSAKCWNPAARLK